MLRVAMTQHRQFTVQLESFQNEAKNAACFVYGEMAVQHAASKSRKLLGRLNRTPTFWLVSAVAFQTAAYISFGRIFDRSSRYNVDALLHAAEREIALFQRDALAERKRDGKPTDPPWLDDYLNKAFYPSLKDFQRLRRRVAQHRAVYERIIRPARNKYIAHRERHGHAEVQQLFGGGKLRELWRLTTFLLQLNEALWELLHNGRKPRLRPIRYSIRSIYDSKSSRSSAHEYIVQDVKNLMEVIGSAPPNPSIQRTGRQRRAMSSSVLAGR
jgi:hypothetical protein